MVTAGLSPGGQDLIRGAHDGASFPHSTLQFSSAQSGEHLDGPSRSSSQTLRPPRRRIVELGLSSGCSVFVLKSEHLDPMKPEHLDPTDFSSDATSSTGSDPPAGHPAFSERGRAFWEMGGRLPRG